MHLHKIQKNSETIWLCHHCDKENYGICSRCRRYRKITIDETHSEKICNRCLTEKNTCCTQCNREMPAGRGRLCEECTWHNTYQKRVTFNKAAFQHELFADYYGQFCEWILRKWGSQKAAHSVNKHILFFLQLDKNFELLPSPEQLLSLFGTDALRRSKLPVDWLDSEHSIKIDENSKKMMSERQQIERLVNKSGLDERFRGIIETYKLNLLDKYSKEKTSLRSIRLALRPAISLLVLCQKKNLLWPDQHELTHYLYHIPGQKAAITGFISFINRHYSTKLNIECIKKLKNQKTKKLEKTLLSLIKSPIKDDDFLKKWIAVGLSYFHHRPINLIRKVSKSNISIDKNDMIAIKMEKEILWLPHWNKIILDYQPNNSVIGNNVIFSFDVQV